MNSETEEILLSIKVENSEAVDAIIRLQDNIKERSQPTFSNIRGSNWSSYIAMQQHYRKAKAIFMLSPRDVAELDFKKPVYLRQYAQAYIVTKVNYQPHASTVELMLIR